MTVTDVTSSTITVQWGSVPCIHQNGNITGYSVTIEAIKTGSTQTLYISGASTTLSHTTFSHLTPETAYEIRVAGANTEGTGVSTNISATTLAGTNIIQLLFPHIISRYVTLSIKDNMTSSSLAVLVPTVGSLLGSLLLLSLIIALLILHSRYVYHEHCF